MIVRRCSCGLVYYWCTGYHFDDARGRGLLREDLDLEVVADSLHGPIYCRLLVSHAPLGEDFADTLADHVFAGLSAQGPA